MSESPPSDVGANIMVRIFEGTAELEREGAAEAASEEFFVARALGLVGTGEDIDIVGNLGIATDADCLSPDAMAIANAESFSPTHERVNHRPPAMPLISRWTGRQCRTFKPVRSSGKTGANPVLIFLRWLDGKGFHGKRILRKRDFLQIYGRFFGQRTVGVWRECIGLRCVAFEMSSDRRRGGGDGVSGFAYDIGVLGGYG